MQDSQDTYEVMTLGMWRARYCAQSKFVALLTWLDTLDQDMCMADVWRAAPRGAFLLHLWYGCGLAHPEASWKRLAMLIVRETARESMQDHKADLAVRACTYYVQNEINRGTLDTSLDRVTLDTPEWAWAAKALSGIASAVTAWADTEDRWFLVLQSAVCMTDDVADESTAARQAAVIRAVVANPWTSEDVDDRETGVLSAETEENPNDVTLLSFMRDVEKHKLTIIKNEGTHRHIRMAQPGTNNQSYEIITWPGSLCYTGDMGTFVFSRLDDMFNFFRRDHENPKRPWVNLSYWHEKLEAIDRIDGSKSFDIDTFHKAIKEYACDFAGVEIVEELTQEQQEDLEPLLRTDDEYEAVAAVRDFDSKWLDLTDFWENRCQEYTPRYVWACYAIVHAIDKFDEATRAPALAPDACMTCATTICAHHGSDHGGCSTWRIVAPPVRQSPRIQEENFVPPFTFPGAGC